MTFANNPNYIEVFTSPSVTLYCPAETHAYHLSRHIAAHAQNIYSSSGITPQLLTKFMDELIAQANDSNIKTLRTNVGILANNIKYRLRYPVDEDCAIRMGCIYTFMEGEDPDAVSSAWTERKLALAKQHPDLYTFFLTEGKRLTPSWKAYEQDLNDMEYFSKRARELSSLLPV